MSRNSYRTLAILGAVLAVIFFAYYAWYPQAFPGLGYESYLVGTQGLGAVSLGFLLYVAALPLGIAGVIVALVSGFLLWHRR